MQILELDFWKDSYEKYLNFGAKKKVATKVCTYLKPQSFLRAITLPYNFVLVPLPQIKAAV
jgi:hypothetical protein